MLRFETEVPIRRRTMRDYDLVVAADGSIRARAPRFADVFKPEIDIRKCKFVWLGTHQKFDDAFTFIFEETEHGWIWAHAYQFDKDTATFIVECARGRLGKLRLRDDGQEEIDRDLRADLARHLGGHALMSNASHIRGSAWLNFPRVLCERWSTRTSC